MCYESLLNGDATERPLSALRREERPKALLNGAAAGLVVAAVLLAGGTGVALTAAIATLAVAFGAVVHQVVLVVAVLSVRAYDRTSPLRGGPA
jgi:hypothetical protein